MLAFINPLAYKSKLTLRADGKLTVHEILTFKPTTNPKDVYLRTLATRDSWARLEPNTLKIKNAYLTSESITQPGFHLLAPKGKEHQVELDYVLKGTRYRDGDQEVLVYAPQVGRLKKYDIEIENASAVTQAGIVSEHYEKDRTTKQFDEIPTGPAIKISGQEELAFPRIILKMHKASTEQTNNAASVPEWRTRLEAEITPDSIMRYNLQVTTLPPYPLHYWQLPFPTDREIFVGSLSGVEDVDISKYYRTTMLKPKAQATSIELETFFPVQEAAGGLREIYILLTNIAAGDESATTPLEDLLPGATLYENVRIKVPPGLVKRLDVTTCSDSWSWRFQCAATHYLHHNLRFSDGEILGQILEPVNRKEAVIRLVIDPTKLTNPTATTRFVFGFMHYWKFGAQPGWAKLIFALIYISGFIFILVAVVKIKRKFTAKRTLAREHAAHQKLEEEATQAILKRDPAFDIEAFKTRGRLIAEKIQHAWCAGDMRECRRYLSQGVYNRFRQQLKIMREIERRQNVMADFKIHQFYVVARHRSGPYDALTVRIDAEARDVMVDAALSAREAKKAAHAAASNTFTEYYTFMRKRAAKTESKENIDACSRCGTPFAGEGEITKCKSCGALMGSGAFDWVLTEITQASEYRANTPHKKPGEGVSADRIEDRASFVFWRDIMTRLTGKPEFIARDATAAYLAQGIARESLSDIAVGAADLENYDDALSPITATVRIKWSARGETDKETRHRESRVLLAIKPEYEGDATFAEHSCATCGAPLPETDSESCSYCRSPIQKQNADWLLSAIETQVE